MASSASPTSSAAHSGVPRPATSAHNSRRRSRRPAAAPAVAVIAQRAPAVTTSPASAPASPIAATTFAALGLPAPIVDALAARGLHTPFPIQALTCADALLGRHVLGRARTGSGKTLGFGLPLLARLAGSPPARPGRPRALILVPTRELATQVQDALAPLAATVNLTTAVIVGGVGAGPQLAALRRGADIVIATPGRLTDHIKAGACQLDAVEVAVIDEADHMADLGFYPAICWLWDRVGADAQRMLFSATLDGQVDRVVKRYLRNPVLHSADTATDSPIDMDHYFLQVSLADKLTVATEIAARDGRTIFFVRTKRGADRLAKSLCAAGVPAVPMHGNRSQPQRTAALAAFSAGQVNVLVATDVAARGIHVDGIDVVVHFDPPTEHKTYLHRSGRTARAGNSGVVLTLVLPEEAPELNKLRAAAKVTAAFLPVGPGDLELAALVGARAPLKPSAASSVAPARGGQPAAPVWVNAPTTERRRGPAAPTGQQRRRSGPRRPASSPTTSH